ncbi:NAD(P)/FAD-dependent oxidoreductase [Kitasatospora sp. NPDC088548]|uniref:NAD(P)/FAD-dependent oxidoreductase n=1 Tax=Kitasatospora sp. NPDC088548 TaxID=3364075 RepID=UPI0038298527
MPKPTATITAKAKDKTVERIKRFLELGDYDVKVTIDPNATDTVVTVGTTTLKNPTPAQLAATMDLLLPKKSSTYDLVVIGGGPAGLAAAINARSLYDLTTLIIEQYAPGGTAATAVNQIDNYLGFDEGIDAGDLCHRAVLQAKKFEAQWLPGYGVTAFKPSDDPKTKKHEITATNSDAPHDAVTVSASLVLLATGVIPRKLTQPTAAAFEDEGIYYYALPADAEGVTAKDTIVVIGGGDSAGRAALMFSGKGAKVVMLIRDTLTKTMLKVISDKIKADKNITVVENTEATEFDAIKTPPPDNPNAKLTVVAKAKSYAVTAVYALISADPQTKWIEDAGITVVRKNETDKYGLAATGLDIFLDAIKKGTFKYEEHKKDLENVTDMATNKPGVFAAGDVRYRAERRIATAAGEGTEAALAMHNYLKANPKVLDAEAGRAAPYYYLA